MFKFKNLMGIQNSPSAEPLGADEFAQLMEDFALPNKMAVAVSGGPDSMALAYCAQNWARQKAVSLTALIVDHGLRSESTAEAEETQKRLAALGLTADILRWDHTPVVSRIHITARKARYKLLTDTCKQRGISELLLAHQLEDQAETILMRFAKGSGIDGLAGMMQQRTMDGVRLLRPLLKVPKERLIATCKAAQISFITDPSNQSEKYARGRLRRVLPLLADEGLTIERLTDLGSRAGDVKEALDHYTLSFLQNASVRDVAGAIHLESGKLLEVPRAISERVLTLCLQHICPNDYPPEHASLKHMLDRLLSLDDTPPTTLHGCIISNTPSQITVMREYAIISEAIEIHAVETILWDQRWLVTLDLKAEDSLTVRALGNPPHDKLDQLAPDLRQKIPQGRIRAGLPALWLADQLVEIPSFSSENQASRVRVRLATAWPPDIRTR